MATNFTPFASLAGGVLIGAAAVLLMAMLGRIAGATGIFTGLFFPADRRDWAWRAAMLAGMVSAPGVMWLGSGTVPEMTVSASHMTLALGGVLVGVGVFLGSGCTSGHGVCGLARLSPRSLVATLTFMATMTATVFVSRHVLGG